MFQFVIKQCNSRPDNEIASCIVGLRLDGGRNWRRKDT